MQDQLHDPACHRKERELPQEGCRRDVQKDEKRQRQNEGIYQLIGEKRLDERQKRQREERQRVQMPLAPAVEQTAASVEPTAAAADSKPVADQPEPAADASDKKDVDGLKVLVLCAGAGTSAMLANAIKEGAAQTGENIASSAGAYGQHTAIMDQYDVIVLAPQVRSYYNDMKADTDRLGIKLLAPRGKEYIDLTRDPASAIKWLRENLD